MAALALLPSSPRQSRERFLKEHGLCLVAAGVRASTSPGAVNYALEVGRFLCLSWRCDAALPLLGRTELPESRWLPPRLPPPFPGSRDPFIWAKRQKCHLEGRKYFKLQSLKASVCLFRRSPTSQKCEVLRVVSSKPRGLRTF